MSDYPVLQVGDSGEWVSYLQGILIEFAAQSSTSAPPASGQFDAVTDDALRAFQRWNGLVDNGIADHNTWPAILEFHGGAQMNFPAENVGRESGPSEELIRSTQTAALSISSAIELSLEVPHAYLDAASNDDFNQWLEWRRALADHVKAHDEGAVYESASIQSWSQTLADVGSYRQILGSNIAAHQELLRQREQERLAGERDRVAGLIASLERIQKAVEDADQASRLVHLVLSLKKVAALVENPSPETVVAVWPGGVPSFGPVIEDGVEVLGSYTVAAQVVLEGFSSVEELQDSLTVTLDDVSAAAATLRVIADRKAEGERLAEYPVMH